MTPAHKKGWLRRANNSLTGVSLREAYNTVFNDDKIGKYKLAQHAKLYGIKNITFFVLGRGFNTTAENNAQSLTLSLTFKFKNLYESLQITF